MTSDSWTTDAATPDFTRLVNLGAARLGALVVHSNDDFFAPADCMLNEGRGEFIADRFTDRGKWMDGWESRRRRSDGHDWCVVRLAFPGIIDGIDCDTNHFLGNHPPQAALDGVKSSVPLTYRDDLTKVPWQEILPLSTLKPGSHNVFALSAAAKASAFNYVRLRIYPDGGVARLKLFGRVRPDWDQLAPDTAVDLAAIDWGGEVLASADSFFGPKDNLIMPGRGHVMGDGWETRRRRGPGHDWVIVRLGAPGILDRLEVDTCHFKGNYPDRCMIEGIFAPNATEAQLSDTSHPWQTLVKETRLEAHKNHVFSKAILNRGPFSHVRLNIYPDGGVMRLRAIGRRSPS